MENKHTRRGFTQNKRVGQALPDNAPAKGHLDAFIPPHPASGHPLPPGARKTTHAFTLIELLVVVLIIGILATVAVPQYQKAVMKSRFATLKPLVRNIANAQETYYLTNGQYAEKITDLDIEPPADYDIDKSNNSIWIYQWGICATGTAGAAWCSIQKTGDNCSVRYYTMAPHATSNLTTHMYAGNTYCVAKCPLYQKLCQQETGKTEYVYGSPTSDTIQQIYLYD